MWGYKDRRRQEYWCWILVEQSKIDNILVEQSRIGNILVEQSRIDNI